jgi:hypothetical protein
VLLTAPASHVRQNIIEPITRTFSGEHELHDSLGVVEDQITNAGLMVGNENPVLQLDVMNIIPEDFRNCRNTEDGLISVYDGIHKFDGCPINNARQKFDRIHEITQCIQAIPAV